MESKDTGGGSGGGGEIKITGRENWRLERDKKNIHMENP